MNRYLTKRDVGLLKGAIRRVFSRSDHRRSALSLSYIPGYLDPSRPRVKKWSLCQECKDPTPTYLIEVDHVHPVVPVNISFEEMSLDDFVDRLWCDILNLQNLCKSCHTKKTKAENAVRKLHRRKKVNVKSPKRLKEAA